MPACGNQRNIYLTLPNLEMWAVFRVYCLSVSHVAQGSLLGRKATDLHVVVGPVIFILMS